MTEQATPVTGQKASVPSNETSRLSNRMAPNLPANLSRSLRDRFDVTRLRPGQADAIESVLDGHHTLAVLPTGSGKSLCYQVPAALVEGLTVVISPLISLMQDQAEKLDGFELSTAVIHSAVGARTLRGALQRVAAGTERIVLTTPEQLLDAAVLEAICRHPVSLLVIDEAHCISHWGHDFRPAYLHLRETLAAMGHPPVLALTATATDAVIGDIADRLQLEMLCVIKVPLYRENLRYAVHHVAGDEERLAALLRLVRSEAGSGIVYAATVKEAERIHAALDAAGESAALYHGRCGAAHRRQCQQSFMSGEVRVMVATNAFGMGIDKADVRFVLHAQLPGSLDAYYQETGRAGRDGEPARCVLLHDERDANVQNFFLANRYPGKETLAQVYRTVRNEAAATSPKENITPARIGALLPNIGKRRLLSCVGVLCDAGLLTKAGGNYACTVDGTAREAIDELAQEYETRREQDRARLAAMVGYARSGKCRWAMILDYYGEGGAPSRCGTCDSCRHSEEVSARPAPTPPAQDTHVKRPLRFSVGDEVIARRYGNGEVLAITRERVDVKFPDGAIRRFLPQFLKGARRPAP